MIAINGALMKCMFGTAPSPLSVLPKNKVMIGGKPAANIMDNKPMMNIKPFAMCTTPSNPAVAASLGAPSACVPVTSAPWITGSPTVMLGKKPALTKKSKLMCTYGGTIQITMPGQFNVKAP